MNSKLIKKMFLSIIGKSSSNGKMSFVLSYLHNRKRFPNLKNPKDLSEIWIKRVLDGEVNKIAYLADKYAVRGFVKNKGLEHILTPILGVYEKSSEIDFDALPNRFALKANFGAGRNIICLNKAELDVQGCKNKIDKWLGPASYSVSERHYDLIPHKFVCEEFIDDGTGGFPVDYKFLCIGGKVQCILACSGRQKGHADYLPYSVNWEPMFHYYRKINKGVGLLEKPKNLSDMIMTAERLADDINLVRVDLYSNGNRIWFGEMTLTPAGCIFHRWSDQALSELGQTYLKYYPYK